MQKLIENYLQKMADENGTVLLMPEESLKIVEFDDYFDDDNLFSQHFGGDLDSGVGWVLQFYPFGYGIVGITGAEKVKGYMLESLRRIGNGNSKKKEQ